MGFEDDENCEVGFEFEQIWQVGLREFGFMNVQLEHVHEEAINFKEIEFRVFVGCLKRGSETVFKSANLKDIICLRIADPFRELGKNGAISLLFVHCVSFGYDTKTPPLSMYKNGAIE